MLSHDFKLVFANKQLVASTIEKFIVKSIVKPTAYKFPKEKNVNLKEFNFLNFIVKIEKKIIYLP